MKAIAVWSCEPNASWNLKLLQPTEARWRCETSSEPTKRGVTSGVTADGINDSGEADCVGVFDCDLVLVLVEDAVAVLVRVDEPLDVLDPLLVPEPVEEDVRVELPVREEEDVPLAELVLVWDLVEEDVAVDEAV